MCVQSSHILDRVAPVSFKAQMGSVRRRVARDVRERLLRDPVDHELLLLRKGKARLEVPADADVCLLADPARERSERAL